MPRAAALPKHDDSNGWWGVLPAPPPPQTLSGERRYKTAVIGAGICGLSAARRLGELNPNEPIAVLEAEQAGFGASGRNAGFLLTMHSHGPPKRMEVLNRNVRLWTDGLDNLRQTVRDHQIQCDWDEGGRIHAAGGPDGRQHLDELMQTLDALEMPYTRQTGSDLESMLGTSFYTEGLHATGNVLVNPAAMLRGLAKTLPQNIDLFEKSPVTEIAREADGFLVKSGAGVIKADRIVIATGVMMRHLGVAANRYVPMAMFASLTEPLSDAQMARFKSGAFGLLAASDNGSTVRLTRDRRIFIRNHAHFAPAGGYSADAVSAAAPLHRKSMLARWPDFTDVKFEFTWAGVMAFTANDGAVFGEIEPNLFAVLTNDVAPMTRGASSGRLLAELMEGQDSDLLSAAQSMLGAKRLPPRPFLDFGIAWKLKTMRKKGAVEF
jgi:glycine/D-amino acid oxidase-like deaminating enzyme